MDFSTWKRENVNLSDLKLDPDNARTFEDDPTQENLRKYLIDYFDILPLANSINQNKGLYPTDNIIVVLENSEYIVVEGNRRTCACKILDNPELIPKDSDIIPSKDTQKNIKKLPVVIAPSRDDAEPLITARHTVRSIKPWSRLSQVRRVMVRYNRGEKVKKISRILSISEAQVRNSIKFNSFIQYVWHNITWTDEEKEFVVNPHLEATKIDRFLPFSKDAQNLLGIYFEDYKFKSNLPKDKLDFVLKSIFRRAIIEDTINTRTSRNIVFNQEIMDKINQNKTPSDSVENDSNYEEPKNGNKPGNVSTPKIDTSTEKQHKQPKNNEKPPISNPKSDVPKNHEKEPPKKQPKPVERKYLFEGIVYEGDYTGISRCLYELRAINYKGQTLSATFLVRTLLECTLQLYLKSIGKEDEVRKKGIDPSLTTLLNYYKQNNVLKGKHNRLQGIIEHIISQKWADVLNSISHAKYSEPDPILLTSIEKQVYKLIKELIEMAEK